MKRNCDTHITYLIFFQSSNGTVVNSTLVKFNETIDLQNGDSIRLGIDERLCFIFTESASKPEILESDRATVSSVFRPEETEFEQAAVLLADSLVTVPAEPAFLNYSNIFFKHEELPIDLSTAGGDNLTPIFSQVT